MNQAKKDIQQVIEGLNLSHGQDTDMDFSNPIRLLSTTPYATVEGIVVHKKRLSGVVLQGLHRPDYADVLNLKSRIVEGQIELSTNEEGVDGVAIGQAMAKKFGLSLGDVFKVVVPITEGFDSFRPKVKSVQVTGILTLGRYEYDLRTLLMDLESLKTFAELGGQVSGLRLNIENPDNAMALSQAITSQLSEKGYWAMNWRQVNPTLFEAIRYEQIIIFLILTILMVAASFNVASTLFISALRKFRETSILQAMGLPQSTVRTLFRLQGLLTGIIGYTLGLGMGLGASQAFIHANKKYNLLNSQVYKLDGLALNIQFLDLSLIFITCLGVCYLSTLGPSSKSKDLPLVEGLKYE